MNNLKRVTAAAAAAAMLTGTAPAFAADSVTVTPKSALASAALKANVTPSDADVSYQWMSGDSEQGPFTPIYKATDAQYIYSTNDKNKYITVEVTDNESGETMQAANAVTAKSLGPVASASLSVKDTPDEYIFYVDGQGFVLLDEFQDENSAYFVMSESVYGQKAFDIDGKAKFDINSQNNIGYFLNNGFLTDGSIDSTGTYKLPDEIIDNIDRNHIWWTEAGLADGDCPEDYSFTAGLSFLSMSEVVKYKSRIGSAPDGDDISWWLRTQRGRSGAGGNILTVESNNKMSDVICTEEKGIRPVFYLGEDFFGSVKIDSEKTGSAVKELIINTYEKEELEGIYSQEELVNLGYPADPGTVIKGAKITADSAAIGAEVTLSAELEISGAESYEYQWIESTSEDGEFTEIRNATEKDYYITTLDKNKYLNCRITPIIDGEAQEPVTADKAIFVESLGFVKETFLSEDVRRNAMTTPAENTFQLSGSERKYVLLDSFNNDDAEFYVMADYITGPIEADSEDPGVFDPSKQGNIAYWLENNYKTTGYEIAGIHKDPIEQEFLQYVDQDHVWWSEAGISGRTDENEDHSYVGAFSVLSHSEAMKYYGVYGWGSVTEHGGWSHHYWTRTFSDSTDSFFCMQNGSSFNDSTGNYVVRSMPPDPMLHEEVSPRPVFYLSHDFFLKANIENEGENVKKAIRQSYSVSELLAAGFTMSNLKERGWIDMPEASGVNISGAAKIGGELYGSYVYNHAGDKPENNTKVGFERLNTKNNEYEKISDSQIYNVTSSDENTYIRFFVEPCDSDSVTGERYYSEPVYISGSAKVIPIKAKLVSDGGEKISSIAGVSEIRPELTLKNITSSEQSATVMIWIYNRNNIAVANMAYEVKIGAGETVDIKDPVISLKNLSSGCYARLYVIDDLSEMNSIVTDQIEVKY